MVFKSLVGTTCICLVVTSFNADAALLSRLGGLAYYDTEANLTWLADANHAKTSGYDSDGAMTWLEANTWAAGLDVVGVTGWRLADSNLCSGYDYCSSSEMGNLFYNVLGGSSGASITYTHNASYDLFNNIRSTWYWLATEYAANTIPPGAWSFDTDNGYQGGSAITSHNLAWAVHDGDVSAVPVPAAIWLFGSGLIGLIGLARRKQPI